MLRSSFGWLCIAADISSSREGLPPIDTMLFLLRDKPDKYGNVIVNFTKHRDATGVIIMCFIYLFIEYTFRY